MRAGRAWRHAAYPASQSGLLNFEFNILILLHIFVIMGHLFFAKTAHGRTYCERKRHCRSFHRLEHRSPIVLGQAGPVDRLEAFREMAKESFYFYFKSKKDLVIEVIYYYEEKILKRMELISKQVKWVEFINDLTADFRPSDNQGNYGCPFTVIGLETAFTEPKIAHFYAASIEKIKKLFEPVLLASGARPCDISVLTGRIFAIYEGELVLYRITAALCRQ